MTANRRILLSSPRTLEIAEASMPVPRRGELLLRVLKVGVCGSDMHLWGSGRIGRIKMKAPLVLGHECVAEVVEAPGGASGVTAGARVAVEPAIFCGTCRWCARGNTNLCPQTRTRFLGLPPTDGAMQEYIVHPAHLVVELPRHISDNAAVMLEPMAIALHAVRLGKVAPGRRILILGTGVIGTSLLSLLGLYRGLQVVCVDLHDDRLRRAAALGATATVRAIDGRREDAARDIREALGGEGADIVFECAGAPDTLWNMCETAGPGGHVIIVGSSGDDAVLFSSGCARRSGLTMRFVRRSLATLEPCIDLAMRGLVSPGELVTHEFAAPAAAEAFEIVENVEDGVLKAVINMRQWSG